MYIYIEYIHIYIRNIIYLSNLCASDIHPGLRSSFFGLRTETPWSPCRCRGRACPTRPAKAPCRPGGPAKVARRWPRA